MRKMFLIFLCACAAAGCRKAEERPASGAHEPVAHFRSGHGVSLPPAMMKSLGVETTDVTEQKITPQIRVPLHVLGETGAEKEPSFTEAHGWVGAEAAGKIRAGQGVRVELPDGKSISGTVQRVEKSAYSLLGDFDVGVRLPEKLEAGTPVKAVVEMPMTGEVVAIPRKSVLRTAEGEFVYVVNEDYFTRTRVETGGGNGELVEIRDGLYAGDRIVTAQVTPLWMTELQTLRAGQSCCKGH